MLSMQGGREGGRDNLFKTKIRLDSLILVILSISTEASQQG